MEAIGTADFTARAKTDEVREEMDEAILAGQSDRVMIRFLPETKIQGRKPGTTHVVDSALAAHYCDAIKVAERVEGGPWADVKPEPPITEDRAMKAPPRGKRGG